MGSAGRAGGVRICHGGDLADRWNTPADARENGPRDLDFEEGHGPGGDAVGQGRQPSSLPRKPGGTRQGTNQYPLRSSRLRMEPRNRNWNSKEVTVLIAKGELGYIPAKHIVSALPEEGERPVHGWEREDEEEVRSHPTSRRQLERLCMTFRTTLLMCTAALPQFGNLKITKEELDEWYEWFYGEDIAGRKPPPSDTTLLFAERNAWRKIHEMVHQGTNLLDSSSGNGMSMSTSIGHLQKARLPKCGRISGRSPGRKWKGGKGAGQSGPAQSKPKKCGVLQGSPPPWSVPRSLRTVPQLPGSEEWLGV